MASITEIRAVNVVDILAAGRHTIVTAKAVTNKGGVIHDCYGYPSVNHMARIAFQRCGYVIRRFTCCDRIVVTTGA